MSGGHAYSPVPQSGGYIGNSGVVVSAAGPRVMAGDYLRLRAITYDSTGQITVNYRLQTLPNYEIVTGTLVMDFSGTGAQTAVVKSLAEGWIIGFDAFISSGTISPGEVTATVDVVQSSGSVATPVMCLASGELTNTKSLGINSYPAQSAVSQGAVGTPTMATIAAPGAGNEFSVTVPSGQAWQLWAIRGLLTASATAASREVSFRLDNGTTKMWRACSGVTHTANQAIEYSGGGSTPQAAPSIAAARVVPLPPIVLPAGGIISSQTSNIQAGDAWTELTYCYSLWYV